MNNESNKPLNPATDINNPNLDNTHLDNTHLDNTTDKKIEDHASEHKLPAPDDVTSQGSNTATGVNHLAEQTSIKAAAILSY